MTIGIYKLIFKGTNKVYIGQSYRLEGRLQQHISDFKLGRHTKKMMAAYTDFGEPSLEILCECAIEELDEFENETIEIWDSVDNGFNTYYTAGIHGSISSSEHFNCKYTKEQIVQVLKLLVSDKFIKFDRISANTGVSVSTIRHICYLESSFWLEEEFPEEYAILRSRKEAKISRLSASSIGKVYPTIYSPEGIGYNITNMCQFAKEHNLQQANLCNVLHGKNKTIKGWHI